MKIDTSLLVSNLSDIPALTQSAEELGFDGIWTAETAHDPFLPLALVAEHSQRVTLGTSIALAFPRSPAILASWPGTWLATRKGVSFWAWELR